MVTYDYLGWEWEIGGLASPTLGTTGHLVSAPVPVKVKLSRRVAEGRAPSLPTFGLPSWEWGILSLLPILLFG